MLLKNAQLIDLPGGDTRVTDVRVHDSRIDSIGSLTPAANERVIDAGGNALLPGLHDHHVHFLSYAASLGSVPCGPPAVDSAEALRRALAAASGEGWLRGYGYHESVAGELTRKWLDRYGPERPIRVQHRTGRLWIVNSPGLEILQQAATRLLTVEQGQQVAVHDGRIYDADALLRQLLEPDLSMVDRASDRLAAFGVTGFDDMTPSNSPETFALFTRLIDEGKLKQRVRMSGSPALSGLAGNHKLFVGCTKVHLHEADLPAFDELCALIATSHSDHLGVAMHCVTETELVFALAAYRRAGTIAGDRIEHASVTPPALIGQLRELQLTVVTQPGFVFERGDAYLDDLPKNEHPWLYRAKSFIDAGIGLAFATDMPFSDANPWRAMQAATTRQTSGGRHLGEDECVSPELALGAFLGDFEDVARPRTIQPGLRADLCLLDRPWQLARKTLSTVAINTTILGGQMMPGSD